MTALHNVFVDANIILELYRSANAASHIKALVDIANVVLMTSQVADEVCRNRATVANQLLRGHRDRIRCTQVRLPDYYLGIGNDNIQNWNLTFEKLAKQLKEQQDAFDELSNSILRGVAKGEDHISMSLKPLLESARDATEMEIAKARNRRERGNPPGKKADPLGDQVSWEQVLSVLAVETPKDLWIVSRDGDFWTETADKTLILNPFLLADVSRASPETSVQCFADLRSFTTAYNAADHKVTVPEESDIPPSPEESWMMTSLSGVHSPASPTDYSVSGVPNYYYPKFCGYCGSRLPEHAMLVSPAASHCPTCGLNFFDYR